MIKRKSKHEFRVHFNSKKSLSSDEIHEIIKWCNSNFGEGGRNAKCIWRYGWFNRTKYTDIFYFKFEKDALFFCMRWL